MGPGREAGDWRMLAPIINANEGKQSELQPMPFRACRVCGSGHGQGGESDFYKLPEINLLALRRLTENPKVGVVIARRLCLFPNSISEI